MASSNPFTDFLMKYTTDYTASSKSDLNKVAVDGDVERVVTLLDGGDVQIDLEDDRGNTPLYMAV